MKRKYLISIVFLILVYISYLFIDYAGQVKSISPGELKADAIVVLTGGKGRADVGLSLLRKGSGEALILSGVNEDSDVESIFLGYMVNKAEKEKIILEKRSRSTYENAVEVRRIIEKKGFKSMILITSGYHMKRAEFIFKKIMPPDINIEPYGVSTPNFDENRWWEGNSLGIMVAEFLKYYWYAAELSLM